VLPPLFVRGALSAASFHGALAAGSIRYRQIRSIWLGVFRVGYFDLVPSYGESYH
jgi:hypothetical protein